MFQNSSFRRRTLARVGVGIGATVAAILALPGIAQAHVTVQPGSAEGGGFSVVAFRVPNERDDASTRQVRVTLPEDQPIGWFGRPRCLGGRCYRDPSARQALEMFGEQLDTVVSKVRLDCYCRRHPSRPVPGLRPQPRPATRVGRVGVRALQTYSSGEKVNWNQVSADLRSSRASSADTYHYPRRSQGGPASD